MDNQDISMNIEGLDEVQRMLDSLPDEVSDKILLDIAMKGGQIVKKELQQAAPDGDSTKKSKHKLSEQVTVKKSDTGTGVNVGFKKSAFYVKFIELGTAVRQTKSGANRGQMERKPFILKAHDSATPKVLDFFSNSVLKVIDKAIKKQLKKLT